MLKMMETPDDEESEKQVMLNGRSIYDLLPRQKNSKGEETENPELPTTRKMVFGIEDRLGDFSRADVCRGLATEAELFDFDVELNIDGNDDGEEVTGAEEEEEEDGTVVSDDEEEETTGTSLQDMATKRAEQSSKLSVAATASPLAASSPSNKKKSLADGGHSPVVGGNKVAENLLDMQKSGRTLSRYSKTLR
jgi:hypothetical protein